MNYIRNMNYNKYNHGQKSQKAPRATFFLQQFFRQSFYRWTFFRQEHKHTKFPIRTFFQQGHISDTVKIAITFLTTSHEPVTIFNIYIYIYILHLHFNIYNFVNLFISAGGGAKTSDFVNLHLGKMTHQTIPVFPPS